MPWLPESEMEPLEEGVSPLIVTGPTLAGKSDLVRRLAERAGAEIITSDKFSLYAGDNFLLGLGMTPPDLTGNVPHLQGILPPEAPLPTTEEYVEMAAARVNEIHERSNPAVIEGCSFSYTMGLVEKFKHSRLYRVHARRRPFQKVIDTTAAAYDKLVRLGLYDETARALDNGYEHTYPMGSILYRHSIEVVRGQITPEAARYKTIRLWMAETAITDFRLREDSKEHKRLV